MTDFGQQSSPQVPVILLGDQDTAAHRDELAARAADKGYVIVDVFGFRDGEAVRTADLTKVDAVVAALGRAITGRMDVWVPFPGEDFVHEQHLRRLSLVLQRHGLNLRFLRELIPIPDVNERGINEVDFALRREVQAVDNLDHAALAVIGAESLSREIELALTGAGARSAGAASTVRRTSTRSAAQTASGGEYRLPPALPVPTVPWAQRKPMLKRYARWLVYGCGVTQAATARVLNSTGQRTPTGRTWQPGTLSKLLNGKYDDATRVG
ncbi:MAG: hypothetical protein ABI307_03510 [Mycobacterium sp.]